MNVASHAARALALAWALLFAVGTAAAADITLTEAPGAPADPAIPSGESPAWLVVQPDGDGGWLATFLAEAGLHEEAFNLPAAMHRYRQGCELTPPPGAGAAWWTDRQASCEGYADAAFALEDWANLDEAIAALLVARPDHPFPPSRFPPLVIGRAEEIGAALSCGELRVSGATLPVELDGQLLGIPPLRMAEVPAGMHQLRCGDRSRPVEIVPEETTELRCPAPPSAATGAAIVDLLIEPASWIRVDGTQVGMQPRLWVFQGGARAVGLWVAPPGHAAQEAPERWLRALAKARTR